MRAFTEPLLRGDMQNVCGAGWAERFEERTNSGDSRKGVAKPHAQDGRARPPIPRRVRWPLPDMAIDFEAFNWSVFGRVSSSDREAVKTDR
ncbi:MAG TPA: hypothetical protein VG455_09620 [Acidimicrobiales bacterium]|nr:hypothetical protein [Acidimicrobiales bacterium]